MLWPPLPPVPARWTRLVLRHPGTCGRVVGGAVLTNLGNISAVTRLCIDRSIDSTGRLVPLEAVPLIPVHVCRTVTILRVRVQMALLQILAIFTIVLVSVLLLGSALTPGSRCPMAVSRRLLISVPAEGHGVDVSTSVLVLSY